MQHYPLMLLEKESNSRQYINAYAKSHGLTLNPAIELGSSHLLAQFAQINLGLTFVIKEFASDYIDGVNLFEIPLSPAIAPRHVGMVKLKGVGLNQAARQFVRLVEGG
jgi:DNA-binding transcriptional LysR family regulator